MTKIQKTYVHLEVWKNNNHLCVCDDRHSFTCRWALVMTAPTSHAPSLTSCLWRQRYWSLQTRSKTMELLHPSSCQGVELCKPTFRFSGVSCSSRASRKVLWILKVCRQETVSEKKNILVAWSMLNLLLPLICSWNADYVRIPAVPSPTCASGFLHQSEADCHWAEWVFLVGA